MVSDASMGYRLSYVSLPSSLCDASIVSRPRGGRRLNYVSGVAPSCAVSSRLSSFLSSSSRRSVSRLFRWSVSRSSLSPLSYRCSGNIDGKQTIRVFRREYPCYRGSAQLPREWCHPWPLRRHPCRRSPTAAIAAVPFNEQRVWSVFPLGDQDGSALGESAWSPKGNTCFCRRALPER